MIKRSLVFIIAIAAMVPGGMLGFETCHGEVVIFSENVGPATPTGTLSYESTPWSSVGLTFTGSGDTRLSLPSNNAGASGDRNVFLTTGGSRSLVISGINTLGFDENSFTLSFNALKSTTASTMSELALSYSIDGISFTDLSIPAQATGTGTAVWRSITFSNLTLPTVSNLTLRWVNTAVTGPQFRLDDMRLSGIAAVPEPGSMLLLGIAGVGGFAFRRFRRRSAGNETTVS